MYIKRIYLKNIRCFKELDLTFTNPEDGGKFILFLGPNGVGKTTILRSIALGLCDETSAAGLISELVGDIVRHDCNVKEGIIKIELQEKSSSESFTIETKIKPDIDESSSEREIRKIIPDGFPWDKLFLCGYGAARTAIGTSTYKKYRIIDAVYTLFNYESPLQNLEIPFYRLSHGESNSVEKSIFRRIELVLDLPADSIRLDKSGISVNGPWGEFIPTGAIGDGYAATLAWISDMVGWAMLYQKRQFDIDFPGIILLDEIEHHLHPSWQKKIISLLHSQFPSIQFIATTHAPMCAIGTTDLRDDECELVTLKPTDKHVESMAGNKPPRGSRADQVLTSYLFGLDTSSDDETKAQIKEYSRLAGKTRNSIEDQEHNRLSRILNRKLGSRESELEREVAKAVMDTLVKSPLVKTIGNKALAFEVSRQLKDLMEGL